MAKIYLASSWRNPYQPNILKMLREVGHDVYDFRNPKPGDTGFNWGEIDPNWQKWTADEYRQALRHPIAEDGYRSDKQAMEWADACVLLLPCGRSAHLEAGWMAGKGKPVFILTRDGEEPELMAKLCIDAGGAVCASWNILLGALNSVGLSTSDAFEAVA